MLCCYKLLICGLLFIPQAVFASLSQGSLGSTSSGTLDVTITIPALVQVTIEQNIALGSISSYPVTGATQICVYSNVASPAGGYYVTATSTNASGSVFRVKDSSTNYITYTAYWSDSSSATQQTTLSSGTKTSQMTTGNTTSTNCSGGYNANFNIQFSSSQVAGAPAADYSDIVTLLITPT